MQQYLSIMSHPLVSIVFPTRNRAHLLHEAILRILKQTYPHFELIIVDDGSTDNTPEVVEEIKKETGDDRIRFIHFETHRGGAQARNAAMRAAKGKYIASQDDDDEWEPAYLERQVNNLENLPDEYGMSYVSYLRILSNGKKVPMPPRAFKPKSGYIYGGDIMHKNYCPFQAGMIRKSVLEKVGLVCEQIDSLYDWEMWLRIAKKYKIAHIDEPLFTWRYTPNSNSSDPKKIQRQIEARNYILKEFGEDIKHFGYLPHHMSRLADLLIRAGNMREARHSLWQGIRNAPFSLMLWLKFIATFFDKTFYLSLQQWWRNL